MLLIGEGFDVDVGAVDVGVFDAGEVSVGVQDALHGLCADAGQPKIAPLHRAIQSGSKTAGPATCENVSVRPAVVSRSCP